MSTPHIIPDLEDEDVASSTTTSINSNRITSLHAIPEILSAYQTMALKLTRERDGRCGTCGIQTHCLANGPFEVKTPLTIPYQVLRGRCLFCHPLPSTKWASTGRRGEYDDKAASLPSTTQQATGNTQPTGKIVSRPSQAGVETSVALDVILSTMRLFPLDETVQEHGCEALWAQSRGECEASATIGRLGGIHLILDAMIRFPRARRLQLYACEALQKMARLNGHCRVAIVQLGGAALVVQAMMRHLSEYAIQKCGLETLNVFATTPELRKDIMLAGGGLAIAHSLKRFGDEESFCRQGEETLETLGFLL